MHAFRIAPEIEKGQLGSLFARSVGLLGWPSWQARLDELHARINRARIWEELFHDRNYIELAAGDVRRHIRNTGRVSWPPKTADEYRLFAFFAMIDLIYDRINIKGKKIVKGRLKAALSDDFGFCPFAFEMHVASHFLRKGFSVCFHDLEEGGGFDLLAEANNTQVEIECKYLSADVGRKIHRNRFCQLAELIEPLVRQNAPGGGAFLQATLPDRLTGSVQQHQAITATVCEALRLGVDTQSNECSVSLTNFQINESPFLSGRPSEAAIADFLARRFNVQDAHIMVVGSPERVAILDLRSAQSDHALEYIFKRAKRDARSQFSGKRPGILCLFFADLTEDQLLELKKDEDNGIVTGIRRAASALINHRPHLHSVALMVDGRVNVVRQNSSLVNTTMVRSHGTTYYFPNTDHPEAWNPVLRDIFRPRSD